MRKMLQIVILFLTTFSVGAQNPNLPADLLSKDFHSDRRQKLRELLPANSVAIFFANPERNRANDVDYKYHQDPDFYYLSGYNEANALLLIFKDKQINPS